MRVVELRLHGTFGGGEVSGSSRPADTCGGLMPWKSAKQRRWAWANKPEMARRWDRKYGAASYRTPRSKKKRRGRLARKMKG